MADDTTTAIFDLLAGDSVLPGLLADFQGEPGIFTMKTVPPDAARPYIWTYGEIANVEFSAKDIPGVEVTRDIWIVADETGDEDPVMTIANRVRDLLHRATLSIGKSNMSTIARGPRIGMSGDDVTARIVTVDFIYEL